MVLSKIGNSARHLSSSSVKRAMPPASSLVCAVLTLNVQRRGAVKRAATKVRCPLLLGFFQLQRYAAPTAHSRLGQRWGRPACPRPCCVPAGSFDRRAFGALSAV